MMTLIIQPQNRSQIAEGNQASSKTDSKTCKCNVCSELALNPYHTAKGSPLMLVPPRFPCFGVMQASISKQGAKGKMNTYMIYLDVLQSSDLTSPTRNC